MLSQKKQESLADHFAKPKTVKQKQRLSTPFSSVKKKKVKHVRKLDHFARPNKSTERGENDLAYRAKPRNIRRKNFNGERRRLFNHDPNKKKKKRSWFKFKAKDPFGRKKNDNPNSAPRGESDLFNNGVLPKMKDFR
jgi:hypothetical protein